MLGVDVFDLGQHVTKVVVDQRGVDSQLLVEFVLQLKIGQQVLNFVLVLFGQHLLLSLEILAADTLLLLLSQT